MRLPDSSRLQGAKEKIDQLYYRTTPFINMQETTAKGNGTTNDTAVFTTLENSFTDKLIDLNGKTYLVDSLPTKNKYVNGRFLSGGSYFDTSYTINVKSNHGVIALGIGAAGASPTFPVYTGADKFYKNIAIGGYALKNSYGSFNNISIGWNAMEAATTGELYNIAIGNESLWSLKKTDMANGFAATRNLAIGMNSMRYLVNGHHNAALGRNSLQCIVDGTYNAIYGVNAMAGIAPLDLTGNIVSYSTSNASENTAMGNAALLNNVANENTAVGSYAATNVTKATRTVASGRNALMNLQKDMTAQGNNKYYWSKTGTYSWSDTTITVTMTGHGLQNGYLISLKLDTGANLKTSEENQYTVANVTTDTFTITAPLTNTTTGNCSSTWWSDQTANTRVSDNNTASGHSAMENTVWGQNNSAYGTWALRNMNGDFNSFFGVLSGTFLTSGSKNSGLGYGALRYMQDGSNATSVTNSTGIGNDSRVSGSNQVQLGDANTTTYAYGAVQARSDARDKIDIEDNSLGLEFINKIKVRDFRYNYRELYEDGDNSSQEKAGERKHLGVIAQEVKEVMDELGVDFDGYQDHSINGGNDVLSIGYSQFIMPLINSVKELNKQGEEKDSKIETLEDTVKKQGALIEDLLKRMEALES